MPRIIAGQSRGLRLVAPAGEAARPTADRTKEALFSILQPQLSEARFLDMYAGSGQIGLEALSRGAQAATFVEKNRRHAALIKENLRRSGLSGGEILVLDALAACRLLQDGERRFDLIYVDPPWPHLDSELARLDPFWKVLTEEAGLVVVEHRPRAESALPVTQLEYWRSCRYGSAVLSFFRNGG